MKWLLELLEKVKPDFQPGGKFERLKPLFDANEHFFFSPADRTEAAPHVRDPLDLKRFMTMVIIAVLPCVVIGIHHFGLRVLAMIVVSYVVGGTIEVAFSIVRKEPINEGFLVTGLLFPLVLPPGLPLWAVGVGVAFGVVVGKEVFGGTGYNLFNPALVGRCFLTLGYPSLMATSYMSPGTGWLGRTLTWADATTADAVTGATPLGLAKKAISSTEAIDLPALQDMLLGNSAGCVGETSGLAIILGGTFLLLTGVGSWRTVVGILGSFLALGWVLHAQLPAQFGPIGWQFFAGGLLFGAFFMATDPVTSPSTKGAKLACGALVGATIVLIRHLTGYVEGVMFAILLGNIVAPIMDEVAIRYRLRKLSNER